MAPDTGLSVRRARATHRRAVRRNAAVNLRSNPVTQSLLAPSPLEDRAYKHHEDLIDALLAAWTAALWHRHSLSRCQLLGADDPLIDEHGMRATIIAPAHHEQRPAELTP